MTNRKFVPENFNVDNEDEVKALYQSLLDENVANSPDALRSWILKWSELGSVLSEVSCRRYVAMTCNTKDEAAAKALSAISIRFLTNTVTNSIKN